MSLNQPSPSSIYPSRAAVAASAAGVLTGLAIAYGLYSSHATIKSAAAADSDPAAEVINAPLHRSNAVSRRPRASRERGSGSGDTSGTQAVGNTAQDGGAADGAMDGAADAAVDANVDGAADSMTQEEAVEIQRTLATLDSGPADDNVTEYDLPQDTDAEQVAASAGPNHGQDLRALVYALAGERSHEHQRIHRGINCDNCGMYPIRGLRYKCVNCRDFDLCGVCEALDCHFATHIFLKIRIPTTTSNDIPFPVWYPGQPGKLPRHLPEDVMRRMMRKFESVVEDEQSRPDTDTLKHCYERFTFVANADYLRDSCGLKRGVDRNAFASLTPKAPRPGILPDLLFKFYDVADHGVIGFEEIVFGSFILLNSRLMRRELAERTFRCVDVDGDGFISRQDLLRVFRAYHEVNLDVTFWDMRDDIEGEQFEEGYAADSRNYVEAAGSLSSYFKEFSDGGPFFGVHAYDSEELTRQRNQGVPVSSLTEQSAVDGSWLPLEDELDEELRRSSTYGVPTRIDIGRHVEADFSDTPTAYSVGGGSTFSINLDPHLVKRPSYHVMLDLTEDADIYDELWQKKIVYPEKEKPDEATLASVRQRVKARCLECIKRYRLALSSQRSGLRHEVEEEERPIGQYAEDTPEAVDAQNCVYWAAREGFNKLLDTMFAQPEAVQYYTTASLPVRRLLHRELDAILAAHADLQNTIDPATNLIERFDAMQAHLLTCLHALHSTPEAWTAFTSTMHALRAISFADAHFSTFASSAHLSAALAVHARASSPVLPQHMPDGSPRAEAAALRALVDLASWEANARAAARRGAGLHVLSRADWLELVMGEGQQQQGTSEAAGSGGRREQLKRLNHWMWKFVSLVVF